MAKPQFILSKQHIFCLTSFDMQIILLSCIEELIVSLPVFEKLHVGSLGLSALRCVRLLRVFKITRFWPTLKNLVISFADGLKSIISLLIILVICVAMFALLGKSLFGEEYVIFVFFPKVPRFFEHSHILTNWFLLSIAYPSNCY